MNPTAASLPSSGGICKFYQRGFCKFGNRCKNIHQLADQKNQEAIIDENRSHIIMNSREMGPSAASFSQPDLESYSASEEETKFEESFTNMICGICFDIIQEKKDKRQRLYGILPNCNHCFCFTCIRRWRQSKDFDLDVAKGCPECRTLSEFAYPSKIWFHEKREKENFISKEKCRMQRIDCKFFRKGRGKCPFGNKCLYRHALSNGRNMDVGPPRPRRRRMSTNREFEVVRVYLLQEDNDGDDSSN